MTGDGLVRALGALSLEEVTLVATLRTLLPGGRQRLWRAALMAARDDEAAPSEPPAPRPIGSTRVLPFAPRDPAARRASIS